MTVIDLANFFALQMVFCPPSATMIKCAEVVDAQTWCSDDDRSILPEILEQILSAAWNALMLPSERRALFATLCLVSKTWAVVFTRVCARDAVAFSSTNPDFYWRLFQGDLLLSKMFAAASPSAAPLSDICRTYTLQIGKVNEQCISILRDTPHDHRHTERRRKKMMRDLLSTFRHLPFLPNLRTLTISYFADEGHQVGRDRGYRGNSLKPEVSRPLRLPTLSARVVRLELEYVLSTDLPQWLFDELGMSGKRAAKSSVPPPCAVPDLEHASFPACADPKNKDNDTINAALGAFLAACPHLQTATHHDGKIQVRIKRASQTLPPGCAVLHSQLEPATHVRLSISGGGSDGWREAAGSLGEGGSAIRSKHRTVISGTAMGLVFEGPKTEKRVPILNSWRNVHIFMRR
ncbi:hypothetical protein BDN70DRAFT_895873 [Pholiota conissans]|uniref:Uncharacterized protein n=1 Tax=Pholiota conissans TaxID=109636 RepID=A0A9P5YYT2_9AGAR|nr:hypothetical protein BDN70DRAFT_895873 [Pholiota conissans]